MFGIGTTEFLVIIVVAILVLGPEHLPRIMRTVTKVMSDFRRVSTEFQRAINLEANQEEWRQHQNAPTTRKKKAATDSSATAATRKSAKPAPDSAAAQAPADELAAENLAAAAPKQASSRPGHESASGAAPAACSKEGEAAPAPGSGHPPAAEPPLQGGRA